MRHKPFADSTVQRLFRAALDQPNDGAALDAFERVLEYEPTAGKTFGATHMTLLMSAARYRNVPVMEVLLARGADPNACDDQGVPVIHFAIAGMVRDDRMDVASLMEAMEALKQGGWKASSLMGHPRTTSGEVHMQVLFQALEHSPQATQWLIDAGVPLEGYGKHRQTFLHGVAHGLVQGDLFTPAQVDQMFALAQQALDAGLSMVPSSQGHTPLEYLRGRLMDRFQGDPTEGPRSEGLIARWEAMELTHALAPLEPPTARRPRL